MPQERLLSAPLKLPEEAPSLTHPRAIKPGSKATVRFVIRRRVHSMQMLSIKCDSCKKHADHHPYLDRIKEMSNEVKSCANLSRDSCANEPTTEINSWAFTVASVTLAATNGPPISGDMAAFTKSGKVVAFSPLQTSRTRHTSASETTFTSQMPPYLATMAVSRCLISLMESNSTP